MKALLLQALFIICEEYVKIFVKRRKIYTMSNGSDFSPTSYVMYILKYIKLAEDLRDNKVSEKQQFHCLIGTTIIFSIIYASRLLPYEGDIKIALLTDVLSLLLMIIGLIIIYRKNQQ